jgi:MoaA/NifB/PqqE/SkfB family radical SAM enzyme
MKIINTAAGLLGARFLGHPFYARFHLTHRCNYRCGMCGLRELADEERELGIPQIETVARRLAALGARHAVITGGEPFLRSDLPEVVAAFARRGFSVRIQTNGGPQVTRERLEACRKAGLRDLSVSIDTMDSDLQDTICGVRGAVGNALRTLDLAADILPRGISQANIVASGFNFEELPALVRRIHAMGMYTYITPVMVGISESDAGQDLLFRSEDTTFQFDGISADVRDGVIDELVQLRRGGYRLTNSTRFLEDFRQYLATGKCDWTCEAGTLCLDVYPDGAVCVCKEKPPVGSILDDDFIDFYRSSGFRELAAAISESCPGCFYGEYREPQYAVRDLSVLREWVGGWFRTYRRGMRLRRNGSGPDPHYAGPLSETPEPSRAEDRSVGRPAVKAG